MRAEFSKYGRGPHAPDSPDSPGVFVKNVNDRLIISGAQKLKIHILKISTFDSNAKGWKLPSKQAT